MDRWMKKNYDFKSRRGILRWFLTCLTLFWMVFIFMMSSAGKDESNSQSGAVCEFICEHFVEGYEEMAPEEQIQMQQKISFPVRKCAHLSEYAVLGALMTLTAASWIRGGEALPALSFCPTTETTASWRREKEDARHAWQSQADTAASWRREREDAHHAWQSQADTAASWRKGDEETMRTGETAGGTVRILPVLAAGFLYAVSDEIHQIFVPGRSGEPRDVLIDTSGVLIGICLVRFHFSLRERRKRKHPRTLPEV